MKTFSKAILSLAILASTFSTVFAGEMFFSPYASSAPVAVSAPVTSTAPATQSEQIKQSIRKASQQTGLPAVLIASLIRKESSFNPLATSRTGARGLTQLMPSTGLSECGLQADELFDIDKNITCGASYLAKQVKYFGQVDLALAAYNAGPGAVRRAIEQVGTRDVTTVTSVLKAETSPYVQKILAFMTEPTTMI